MNYSTELQKCVMNRWNIMFLHGFLHKLLSQYITENPFILHDREVHAQWHNTAASFHPTVAYMEHEYGSVYVHDDCA